MRTSIFAVAAIVAASWAIDHARAADRITAFDIVRNCNAEVANVGIEETVADCTKNETDAKNELDKSWPRFGASDKQTCGGESSTGGGQPCRRSPRALMEELAHRQQIDAAVAAGDVVGVSPAPAWHGAAGAAV